MPEIGEIARLVHYLRKNIVGKTISSVKVQEDDIVYGKVGTSATQFQKAITGKRVLDAQQQGKYFWLVMSSPPHPLLHASMTGWIKFSNDDSSYYKPTKKTDEGWPPRFWKFILETDEQPPCEAAFVDPRRLGRIRLLDCAGDKIRQTPPLSENGPDPVRDKDMLTKGWFIDKVKSKRVPVKAFLLDQANISGVGNWVADEILFHARIHPEQYTGSFSDAQLDQLHKSLLHICAIAVETLADQEKFPKEWLMKYRWGKGQKGNKLPTGEAITFLTVGGRTSAVVPSLQKKSGPVAGDVSTEETKGRGNHKAGKKTSFDEEDKASVETKASSKRQRVSKAGDEAEKDVVGNAKPSGGKDRTKRTKTEAQTGPGHKLSASKTHEKNTSESRISSAELETQGKKNKNRAAVAYVQTKENALRHEVEVCDVVVTSLFRPGEKLGDPSHMASDLEMADSPLSTLSSLVSDDLIEELKTEERDVSVDPLPEQISGSLPLPPSKRRRTALSWDEGTSSSPQRVMDYNEIDISSDSSGDVPGSPTNASQAADDEAAGHEQVTVCRWEGCSAGDLGNMDTLVRHIHKEHIGSRQKKYACEWDDCTRKGMSHASGYALRAHMRSHTREKPFYCALPECDRSFTRSDALAKHMRTVHETEALRPSDPVPKNHPNPPSRFPRLKLILSARPPDDPGRTDNDSIIDADHHTTATTAEVTALASHSFEAYPADLGFTVEEMALPPKRLFQLLSRQLRWAEEETQDLRAEVETLERRRKEEWMLKELVLENVMEYELVLHSNATTTEVLDERKRKTAILPMRLPLKDAHGESWFRDGQAAEELPVLDPDEALA